MTERFCWAVFIVGAAIAVFAAVVWRLLDRAVAL